MDEFRTSLTCGFVDKLVDDKIVTRIATLHAISVDTSSEVLLKRSFNLAHLSVTGQLFVVSPCLRAKIIYFYWSKT